MPSIDTSVLMCSRVGCAGRPVARFVSQAEFDMWKQAKDAGSEYEPVGDTLCSVDLMVVLSETPDAKLAPIKLPRLRIDPSEIITPMEVELELRNLLNRQQDGVNFLKAHRERLSEVETNFALTKAASLAASEKRNDKLREAEALLACSEIFREMRAEDLIVKTTTDQLHAIRAEIEVWRSLGASVRSSIENAGRGQVGGSPY